MPAESLVPYRNKLHETVSSTPGPEVPMTPVEEREIFAQRLKEARDERDWTQSRLAEEAGLTASAISQFESEDREPNFGSIVKLAHALEVSPAYLAGLEEYEATDEETRALLRELKGLSKKDRSAVGLFAAQLRQRGEEG